MPVFKCGFVGCEFGHDAECAALFYEAIKSLQFMLGIFQMFNDFCCGYKVVFALEDFGIARIKFVVYIDGMSVRLKHKGQCRSRAASKIQAVPVFGKARFHGIANPR